MENQNPSQPTTEQITERIKRQLFMEMVENGLPELLDHKSPQQAEALEQLTFDVQTIAGIQTFSDLMDELNEQGHDAISAIFYVLDAYTMEPALRQSIKGTISLIPPKGWMD